MTSESGRVIAREAESRTGAEELRLIVRSMNSTCEGFNDRFTLEQLVQIYRMYLASEWEILPNRWTPRQIKEALAGKPPAWVWPRSCRTQSAARLHAVKPLYEKRKDR